MDSNKKRILVVSTNDGLSGAPLYIKSVLKNLRTFFYFSAVFGEDGPVGCSLRDYGIPVMVIKEMRSKINPIVDLIAAVKLFLIVKKIKPDFIYAHSSKAGMLARVMSLLTGIPTVYTVHGWGWRGMGFFVKNFIVFIEKLLSFIPNCYFIYVSNSVQIEGQAILNLKKEQGLLVLNGTNDVLFDQSTYSPNSRFKMMMVARVAPAKDHETLIRAFELSGENSELWLCGEGTDSNDFKNLAKLWAPNRYHSIQFLGDRPDVPSLLNKIDLFLLISKYEALPLSIIEAMSAGKAIVATNTGGISELISNNENGLLVEIGDVLGVSEAISKLKNQTNRDIFGQNSRSRYLEKFTVERMTTEIKIFFSKLSV